MVARVQCTARISALIPEDQLEYKGRSKISRDKIQLGSLLGNAQLGAPGTEEPAVLELQYGTSTSTVV